MTAAKQGWAELSGGTPDSVLSFSGIWEWMIRTDFIIHKCLSAASLLSCK